MAAINSKLDSVLDRLDELKKDLTELGDYLSKEVGTLPEPEEKSKKSTISPPKQKSNLSAPKAPSMLTPKKPKSSFSAPKAPSMPAPKKPK